MSSSIYQLWIVKYDKLPHVFINILQPHIYIYICMYICIYIFLITGQKLLLNSVELNTRKVDNHIDNLHSRPIQIHWTIDHSNKLLLLTSTLCPLQCDNVLFIYLFTILEKRCHLCVAKNFPKLADCAHKTLLHAPTSQNLKYCHYYMQWSRFSFFYFGLQSSLIVLPFVIGHYQSIVVS